MRLSARMIAEAAFVVFLMSAFSLCAEEAAKPLAGNEKAVDSSYPIVGGLAAPMPMASMAAAMVLAVYIPPQAPAPGQELRTMARRSSSPMLPERNSP